MSAVPPYGVPLEDYAEALPETAQPTAPEPEGDAGHLLPQAAWDAVVRDAEARR